MANIQILPNLPHLPGLGQVYCVYVDTRAYVNTYSLTSLHIYTQLIH